MGRINVTSLIFAGPSGPNMIMVNNYQKQSSDEIYIHMIVPVHAISVQVDKLLNGMHAHGLQSLLRVHIEDSSFSTAPMHSAMSLLPAVIRQTAEHSIFTSTNSYKTHGLTTIDT